MTNLLYGSICTGGGGADSAARSLGLRTAWGIEYDPQIAAVAQRNDPTGIIYAASCVDIDYESLARVDVMHASTPCPSFSVAKTDARESADDLAIADSVCRALRAQRPLLFTLENVRGYVSSQSFARIQAQLLDLDYAVSIHIVNAADLGVPQTRIRLYLIAHAGGFMQRSRSLPSKQPWRGWYDAVADLTPSMPDSQFAQWQLDKLPADLKSHILVNGGDSRAQNAFIADGQTNKGESITLRAAEQPAFTLTAGSGDRRPIRAYFAQQQTSSRVVALTPRALARLQSFPDSFLLPDQRSLACRIIGNAVAPLAYAQILQSQL